MKLSSLPVSLLTSILDIRQTMVSPAVGRGRVHAASCVTPFGKAFLCVTIAKLQVLPVMPPYHSVNSSSHSVNGDISIQ